MLELQDEIWFSEWTGTSSFCKGELVKMLFVIREKVSLDSISYYQRIGFVLLLFEHVKLISADGLEGLEGLVPWIPYSFF